MQAADKCWASPREVLDIHDGELEPTLENRKKITRLIRDWKADIVIAHRPWDYHPDHRYVGVLVQDAAYMVAVPFFCPDTPPLKTNPLFLYSSDGFQKPYRFKPDIVVAHRRRDRPETRRHPRTGIAALRRRGARQRGAIPARAAGYGRGRSQGVVPQGALLGEDAMRTWPTSTATRSCTWYGPEKGKKVKHAEAFEICEYGRRVTRAQIKKLFPFYP